MAGLVITNYMVRNVSVRIGMIVSITIIIGYWLSDVAFAFGIIGGESSVFYVFRSILGIPLVYIGYRVSVSNVFNAVSNRLSYALFIIGVFLMMFEVPLLKWLIEGASRERQFPLFSVPVALALLSICINTTTRQTLVSKAGRDFSLGIYIIHPFLLYFIVPAFESAGIKYSLLNLVSAFILSLLVLYALKHWVPFAY